MKMKEDEFVNEMAQLPPLSFYASVAAAFDPALRPNHKKRND
jgi:hypothetical protein